MKTKIYLILFLLLVLGCFLFLKQEAAILEDISQNKKNIFFVEIPITKFTKSQCACVDVKIEDKAFTMKLDLGFQGHVSINEDKIDQIVSKEFLDTHSSYGIRGKKYSTNLYRISEINIGAMSFSSPVLQERRIEFLKDCSFVSDGAEPSPKEIGKLGWQLFQETNILVDVKNSRIAFCDSFDTLKENQCYAETDFISTPIILERGMVEVEFLTPDGLLRCILDTGSTFNLFNAETAEGKSFEQAIWDPANQFEYSSFQIGGKEFGPVHFCRIPMNPPVPIEAILGMEFFENHIVFFDFVKGYVYFATSNTSNESALLKK